MAEATAAWEQQGTGTPAPPAARARLGEVPPGHTAPTVLEVLRTLDSGPRGLTEAQAEERTARLGENTGPARREASWAHLFVRSLRDPFTAVLGCLGLVSAAVFAWGTASVILLLVVVSCALRACGEHRADRSTAALRELVATTATVVRRPDEEAAPATREVPVAELVPGDVIRLAPGDLVPADVRLLRAGGLTVHQAALTGESEPVAKTADDPPSPAGAGVFEQPQLCFQGSSVASGSATAVVHATGAHTRFAAAHDRTAGRPAASAFDRSVNGISWILIRFMLLTPPLVLMANAALRGRGLETLPFAVAVAVGLTPEMLPVLVTLCLARGASLLARTHGVIVKRLPALHDVGAVDVLCLDKTGTLTEDRPVADRALGPDGQDDPEVLHWAAVNAWWTLQLGDLPQPDALDEAILDAVDEDELTAYDGVAAVPFAPDRRLATAVVEAPAARRTHPGRQGRRPGGPGTLRPRGRRAGTAGRPRRPARRRRYASPRGRHRAASGPRTRLHAGRRTRPHVPGPDHSAGRARAHRHRRAGGPRPPRCLRQGPHRRPSRDGRPRVPRSGHPRRSGRRAHRRRHRRPHRHRTGRSRPAYGPLRALHPVAQGPDHPGPAQRRAHRGLPRRRRQRRARPARRRRRHRPARRLRRRPGGRGRGARREGPHRDRPCRGGGPHAGGNIATYLRVTLSSNLGNVLAMLCAGLLLPFLPMLPAQVLMQNLCFDAAQLTFAHDRPHPSVLDRPTVLDPRRLLRFITGFGALNAVADLATFGVLALALHGPGTGDDEAVFHSGWFTENLLTQALVMVLLRAGRTAAGSRGPSPVAWAAITPAAAGLALPASPLGPILGLTALPALYYVLLAAVLFLYAVGLLAARTRYERRRGSAPARAPAGGTGAGRDAGDGNPKAKDAGGRNSVHQGSHEMPHL